jgi:hypothetical protein
MITFSINVDKLDRTRVVEGKKGRYMDFVLIETPNSDFSDYLVKQRGEKGEDLPILGNGKIVRPKNGGQSRPPQQGITYSSQPAPRSDEIF